MKTPIRIEDEELLVGHDHELICRTFGASRAELRRIVKCVNGYGELLKAVVDALPVISKVVPDEDGELLHHRVKFTKLVMKYAMAEPPSPAKRRMSNAGKKRPMYNKSELDAWGELMKKAEGGKAPTGP